MIICIVEIEEGVNRRPPIALQQRHPVRRQVHTDHEFYGHGWESGTSRSSSLHAAMVGPREPEHSPSTARLGCIHPQVRRNINGALEIEVRSLVKTKFNCLLS